MTNLLGPRMAGGRPVVARVTVKQFYVPGPVATLMAGGSSALSAGVDIVDAKSGEMILSIPPGQISSTVYRPGGIVGVAVQASAADNPSEWKTREMARAFAEEYTRWFSS